MFRPGILQKPYAGAVLLGALFCLLYLASLGARPLFIPDEVRYGEIAREILANGNWVVPRLDGLLYFEKPPFGYWLNAISLALFGENPFAVRFVSAFSAGLSSIAVYFLGRKLFASKFVAYLATFIFMTTFEVQAVGTYSVLDSLFAALLNCGMALFVAAALANPPVRTRYLIASGIFFGAAFLTKGFLALALPALVLIPWLALQQRYDLLFRHSWVIMIVAAIVIAPWSLAIHQQQPDFWRYFFWVEHVQRFAGENAQHAEPFWFYLAFLPLLAFPWLAVLPVSILNLKAHPNTQGRKGALSLLLFWSVLPLAFFSVASGKLATYILPCFLPFSLIVAAGLNRSTVDTPGLRWGMLVAGAALAVALAALLKVQISQHGAVKFEPDEQLKFVILTATLLFAILMLGAGWAIRDGHLRVLACGLAVIPVLVALPWVIPGRVLERKAPVAFIQHVYAGVPPDTEVVTNGSLIRAVCWAVKRDDVRVIGDGGELAYGLSRSESPGRSLTAGTFGGLLKKGKRVLLLCKGQCANDVLAELPLDARTWSWGDFHGYLVNGTN